MRQLVNNAALHTNIRTDALLYSKLKPSTAIWRCCSDMASDLCRQTRMQIIFYTPARWAALANFVAFHARSGMIQNYRVSAPAVFSRNQLLVDRVQFYREFAGLSVDPPYVCMPYAAYAHIW